MELNTRYKWTTKEIKIENVLNNGHIENGVAVIICVEDMVKGIKIPHPITHFIRQIYTFKGVSLSSQLNPAREICKFLNFINRQLESKVEEFIELKDKGIKGLQLIHGAKFITYLTNKRDKNNKQLAYTYVKQIERYLTSFYEYLSNMDLIDGIEFDKYVDINDRLITLTPFDNPKFDTMYPPSRGKVKHKLKDFGNEMQHRDKMVVEFLKVAENIAPDIALGIALQIFGGLRRGEVVNLTRNNIPSNFLNGDNSVVIEDNQEKLFSHLSSYIKSQVKNPRIQLIFQNILISRIYENHLIMIQSRKNIKNMYALFVNEDGEPISGDSYEKKFNLVKRKYIEILGQTNGRYNDYKILDESIWGTHIGRGIFTNYLFDLNLDERQMAIARGDKSTKSAKDYLDYRNALSHFQNAMNKISSIDSLS